MITVDRKCLSGCGSLLMYGTDKQHLDIRLNTSIEMILPFQKVCAKDFAVYSYVYWGQELWWYEFCFKINICGSENLCK